MVLSQTGQELINEFKKLVPLEKLFNSLKQYIQIAFGRVEMKVESIEERLDKMEKETKEQLKDLNMKLASMQLILESVAKRFDIAKQLEPVVVPAISPEEKPKKGKGSKSKNSDELKANILGTGVNGSAQFFKWAYYHKNDFVSPFITEADKKVISSAPTLAKYTDPEDRRVEEGKFFWEKMASEETKKKIKDVFLKWKVESKTLNDGAEIDQRDSEA